MKIAAGAVFVIGLISAALASLFGYFSAMSKAEGSKRELEAVTAEYGNLFERTLATSDVDNLRWQSYPTEKSVGFPARRRFRRWCHKPNCFYRRRHNLGSFASLLSTVTVASRTPKLLVAAASVAAGEV